MKRIILHIGTEKTGTSTIQRFFHRNSEKLLADGILYPKTPYGPDAPSHIALPVYARDESRVAGDMHGKFGIKDMYAEGMFRDELKAKFYEEFGTNEFHTMVLSSEHLSSRLSEASELERLKDLLEPMGQVEVLLYLRPQEELVASSYSTTIRLGSTLTFSKFIEKSIYEKYYDYQSLCDLWAGGFGKENMQVRIFSKTTFAEGDLLSDFVKSTALPMNLADYVRPPNENESLGLLHLEFIRQFNFHLPHMGPHTNFQADPRQGGFLRIMGNLNKAEKARLPAPTALKIREHFAASNTYVARQFFHKEEDGLFDLRPLTQEELADTNLDLELPQTKAFEIFAKLWERSQAPQGK